jgi:hypothetical protein
MFSFRIRVATTQPTVPKPVPILKPVPVRKLIFEQLVEECENCFQKDHSQWVCPFVCRKFRNDKFCVRGDACHLVHI